MRVIFLPEGGFEKNGGFIEVADGADISGKEEVYQRQGFLTLRLKCRDLELRHGSEVRNEMTEEDADPAKRATFRSILATGDIQKSRWSRYRLSILGREAEHSAMMVTIRENEEGEAVFAAGMSGDSDLDHEYEENFFVEVVLSRERMDGIMSEVQMPGAELRVDVKLSMFPRFYAPWSPSIDEGRVIKFLDSERDVENAHEIPDEFWNRDVHRGALADPDRAPVSVVVVRRLGSAIEAETPDEALDMEEDEVSPAPARTVPADQVTVDAIGAAARKISRGLLVLSGVLVVAALIVAA